jgi:glutamyl-tRNA synthetase
VRYIARLNDFVTGAAKLYGNGEPLQTTQIDFFVELSYGALTRKEVLPAIATQLNSHLQSRTFFVGRTISIADITVAAAIRNNGRWTSLHRNVADYGALIRWFNFVDKIVTPQATATATTTATKKSDSKSDDSTGAAGAAAEQSEGGNFDIDLPGAEFGKVVTRFPPEPSGYMHIGHAKAALLNYIIAQKYGGHVILRFDDTNPSKEKVEYVDNILNDLETLGRHTI